MFTPFVGAPTTPQANPAPAPEKAPASADLDELKKQLSDVQKRLDSLANKP
jgi:polyhydroxyalkanoate synthesis regulator protein